MCILVDNENRIYIKVLFEFSTSSVHVVFFVHQNHSRMRIIIVLRIHSNPFI